MLGNPYGIDLGNIYKQYYAIQSIKRQNELLNQRLNYYKQSSNYYQQK